VKLAAIVLAAGAATRFGGDKMSAEFRGEPLLHHAIRAARAAPVGEVLVVTKPGVAIGEWTGGPPVRAVRIESDALSESLKAGIAAAGEAGAAFVFLGDMPLVPHEIGEQLAAKLSGHYAVVPSHDGSPGHPALLSARAFADIARLAGNEGAGRLLKRREDVLFLDWPDDTIHLDIDRAADLERLEAREALR
jgi:molybdenum cofactor cytidylyltransferase